MRSVEIQDLSIQRGGRGIVSNVSLSVGAGEMVGLVGPNGSGKSTLLRALYRAHKPSQGIVFVEGEDLWRMSSRASARLVGAVCQESTLSLDMDVLELVQLGRFPHKEWFQIDTSSDRDVVWNAIGCVGLTSQALRPLSSLSGGERQRAMIAKGLAQEPRVLVLDEPTNHLDLRYQMEILSLVRALPIAKLVTLHDLNLAAEYCDRIYLLSEGGILAGGTPAEVLTPERILQVYGLRAVQGTSPLTGRPILYFSKHNPTASSSDRGHSSEGRA